MADDERPVTPSPDPDGAYHLRLYVAGQSPKSVRAVENLRHVCEEYLPGRYTIELVDLVEHPERARTDEIIADLSDTDKVLIGLQLDEDRLRS